jgi:hypothetical protein
MPAATPGYSGTPLAKKLGIKPGSQVVTRDAPTEYLKWLGPLPPSAAITKRISASTDIVHVFTTRRANLERELNQLRKALRPDAAVWVSWPKKGSKVPTNITEDVIRQIALPMGWVDIKVCAVSEVWSGLKLVVRKDLR